MKDNKNVFDGHTNGEIKARLKNFIVAPKISDTKVHKLKDFNADAITKDFNRKHSSSKVGGPDVLSDH